VFRKYFKPMQLYYIHVLIQKKLSQVRVWV